nr:methyltransferase domain-containing protein [Paenibacillus sp. ACRRY]
MEVISLQVYDNMLMFLSCLKNPKRVGSIIPSSKYLAAKVISYVPWESVELMAELGAGTGAITQFYSSKLPIDTKVLLFERDKRMRNHLKSKYPNFLYHSNASYLQKKMNQENIQQLDCIICGLPFFYFSNEMKQHILQQIWTALKPGGFLVLYQNSLHMRKKLSEQFDIERIEFVALSFLPAFVYVCRKIEDNTICSSNLSSFS